MADLFEDLGGPGPFADVSLAETPVTNAQAQFRRAQVSAAANIDLNQDQTTLLDQFGTLQQQYLDNIAQYGEGFAETDAATKQLLRRTEGLRNLAAEIRPTDPTNQVGAMIDQATTAALNADIEHEKEAALERAATDNIMDLAASGDRVTAEAYLNLMEHGSVLDQVRDSMTKSMILQRELDRYNAQRESQPWFAPVINLATDILLAPLNNTSKSGLVDIPSEQKGLLDWLFPGDRQRAEAAALHNKTPEEFAKYVREQLIPAVDGKSSLFFDMWQDQSEGAELIEGLLHTPRPLETNAWATLDMAGVLPLGYMTKIGRTIPSALTAAGARRQVATMTANALRNGSLEGMDDAIRAAGFADNAEVIDNLSPAAIKPQSFGTNGQALANEMLMRGRAIADSLSRMVQTGRFANAAERQAAIQNFIERESERFGNSRVIDVDSTQSVRLTDNTSVHAVEFTLGRNNVDGFAKKTHAERLKTSYGFEDARVEQIEGGTWVVKVQRAMPETGTYIDPLKVKTSNVLSRFMLGSRQRSDDYLFNKALGSESNRNKLIQEVHENLWKDIKVSAVDKERVGRLWAYGENKGMWFENRDSANVFFQRNFSRDIGDNEWNAYSRMRDINDFEYAVRNDIRWKEMSLRGLETIRADIGVGQLDGVSAYVDEAMTRPVRGRVLNTADGSYSNSLTAEQIDSLVDRGYVLVHLDEVKKLDGDLGDITAVVVKQSDLRRSMLDPVQLPYRAGGHRIYADNYFGKQARKDAGNWKNPNTYIAGTKAEVTEWSNVMEQARLAYLNDPNDLTAIDDIFAGRPGYPTAEKFTAGMADGTYSKDYSFVALFDRDLPREYDQVDRAFMPEEPEEGMTSFLRTHGRLYYGQKGSDSLVDWRGEQAAVLDPFETIDRAFTNIANLSTFNDYKITAVQRWVNTFGDKLDKNSYAPGATAMQKFLEGKPIRAARTRDSVYDAMQDQRDIIMRNLGWKTEFDMQVDQAGRRFADFLMGNTPGTARHKATRDLVHWASNKNPLGSLRGLAFDMKLGLFNPVQLFLQAGTFIAITAIDPKNAIKAVGTMPLMRMHLLRDDFLQASMKGDFWKAAGFDDIDEYAAFMRVSKASGFLTINEAHALMNSMGPNTVSSLTGNAVHDIRQMGRVFFNEGELINRTAAMRSAWEWTKTKFPDWTAHPDDFLNAFRGRAEDLSFNMSRTSQAWWQQGITSVPTQFMSYQARMMENMFGGVLSRGERARLILSQGILYGAAGIPLAPVLMDMYKGRFGAQDIQDIKDTGDAVEGFIDRGMLDLVINGVTGADVQASDRLGTGAFFGDTVGELMGFSQYGEQSTLDILGGAVVSVTTDLFKDLKPFLSYMSAESGGDIGRLPSDRAFRNLAMNITSVSTALKFMMVRNHGIYIDNNGNYRVSGIPSQTAWWSLLLGAQPGETNYQGAMMTYMKERGKAVDEAVKVVEQYRREMIAHPERYEDLGEEINIFVSHLDPDIRRSVLAQAHRQTHSDVASSIEERYQKLQTEREMLNQLEQDAQQ